MSISAAFIEQYSFMELNLPTIDINQFAQHTHPSCKVLIHVNDIPILVLNIHSALDKDGYILEQCFKDIKISTNKIIIIHGRHTHLFDIESYHINSIDLHDYVGHIYSLPDLNSNIIIDDFLVTTFEYTFLINLETGIKWRSGQCAIDGVLIHDINQGIITGSGEWDPPGGWEPFSLDLRTGSFTQK